MKKEILYEEISYRLLIPMTFRIHNNKIEAIFLPFKYKVSLSEIEDVKIWILEENNPVRKASRKVLNILKSKLI